MHSVNWNFHDTSFNKKRSYIRHKPGRLYDFISSLTVTSVITTNMVKVVLLSIMCIVTSLKVATRNFFLGALLRLYP